MATVYGMHLPAHVGTLREAGAIVQVRDDYRAAKRPIISQLNGNWAFQTQSQGCECPQL